MLKALAKRKFSRDAWKSTSEKHSYLGQESSDDDLTEFEKILRTKNKVTELAEASLR